MFKWAFWQNWQRTIWWQPFQIKDKANKTLLMRAKWLFIFSLIIGGLFIIIQNRQLYLLINRESLEKQENEFVNLFYPQYYRLYYWMKNQANLAIDLKTSLDKKIAIDSWLNNYAQSFSLVDGVSKIELGLAGTNEQWQAIRKDNDWEVTNNINQEFATMISNQDWQNENIYWAENQLSDTLTTLALFWVYTNDQGEKTYVKVTADFNYLLELEEVWQRPKSGAVVFLGTDNQSQFFPFWEIEEATLATLAAKLATERANLFEKGIIIDDENGLIQALNLKKDLIDQSIFHLQYSGENFWIKITPIETQTDFMLMAVILRENHPLYRLGISARIITLLVIIIIIINFLLFFYYYWRYLRQYYFTNEIKDIIKSGESAVLEFKSSLRYDYKQKKLNKELENIIIKSVAAFNNSDGGIILLGVNDKGKILGLKKDYETLKKPDRDGFELHLRAIISQAYGQHFAARRIEIFFPHVNKEEVCMLKIKKGRTPIYTMTTDKTCGARQEKFYIRMGNSCREIEKPSDIVTYQKERFTWKLKWSKNK